MTHLIGKFVGTKRDFLENIGELRTMEVRCECGINHTNK